MLRRAGLLTALTALLVPAVAGTTTASAKTRPPVVKKVTPKHVFVGQKLTIRGRHFRRGVGKNLVAFKRDGAKAVFVPAEKATAKMLVVTLPKRLEKILVVRNGTPTATRLRVRVLSKKFGKRFSSRSKSPIVGPERPDAPDKPDEVDPNADCDGDHVANKNDGDDDGDLLSDVYERSLSKLLDTCKADTDEDGVEDGYEYQSARDLNDDEGQNANEYTPYPRKLPFPNPLDGTDGDTDHDGDDLTLMEEYRLWRLTGPRTLERLNYSAGEQFSRSTRAGGSGVRTPNLPAGGYDKQTAFLQWANARGYRNVMLSPPNVTNWWTGRVSTEIRDFDRDGDSNETATYYDFFPDGFLSDSERDEDGDGLTNWAETRGCLGEGDTGQAYWTGLYKEEHKYYLAYQGTKLDDADTDGDGILDGADDQDNDDVPNVMECSRSLAADMAEDGDPLPDLNLIPARPLIGFVNPFNPCLPHRWSRACKRILPAENAWAPFNPDDKYYFILN
jgi:hypothetical protein